MDIPLQSVFVVFVASSLNPRGEELKENDHTTRLTHKGNIMWE